METLYQLRSILFYFDCLVVSCKPTMIRPPASRKDLCFESQQRSICIAELADGITAKSEQTKLHLRTTLHSVGEINNSREESVMSIGKIKVNRPQVSTSYLFLLPKEEG